MQEFPDDHRGHTIFTHASGPSRGPWIGAYTAWKIESNNSYRGVLQGTVKGEFSSVDAAHAAAKAEAKNRLNALLDGA